MYKNNVNYEIRDDGQVRKEFEELDRDTAKLVTVFGAASVGELKKKPDYMAFHNGLLASHRDFDTFYERLISGEKSAIVSGLNPSGPFHIGHIGVFDTNLFFQERYGIDLYAPISDDESYVAGKIRDQRTGLKNAFRLVREMLAYGYEPGKTHFIIDQIYTNIYNLAIRMSRGITLSTVKAIYGYSDSDNVGLTFYPSVQSAHVVFPQTLGIGNVLVPIGPDEDTHLRAARDIAEKFGFRKVSVLHGRFLPGLDGKKMSKSKGNAIYLMDDSFDTIRRKVSQALSGGKPTVGEHRRSGGIPEIDISCIYLKYLFYDLPQSEQLYADYRSGRLLSGDVKDIMYDKILDKTEPMRKRLERITVKEMANSIMCNEGVDVGSMIDKSGVMSEEHSR